MSLGAQSLFLYGLQVTPNNQSLDFKTSAGGAVLQATLTNGFYSLGSLLTEVVKQLQAADPANTYTATVDRTISGGTQNRVTIATSTGTYLSLLFSSGPRSASNCATLLGFSASDYTGALTYQGSSSAGTALVTQYAGYGYIDPAWNQKIFGAVNVSASGSKEAIVFQQQKFIDVEFKYETKSNVVNNWSPMMIWMMQQRLFEFTPEVTSPTTFYQVTLEHTSADGKGLGFKMSEMLPQFPGLFKTGTLKFRVSV